MRFLFQSFALAVLLGQPVLAQDRTDFSGEWVRVEPATATAVDRSCMLAGDPTRGE